MSLPTSGEIPVLLHNPRCSKSRATHALLEERGVAFHVREYLQEPLSAEELGDLERRLGKQASQWLRKGEAAYEQAGLGAAASDQEVRAAIAKQPILMERPILVSAEAAAIGRPPENVLSIL